MKTLHRTIQLYTAGALTALLVSGLWSTGAYAIAPGNVETTLARQESEQQSVVESDMSPQQRISYALGMVLGDQFRGRSIELDLEVYLNGLQDGLAGKETALGKVEARVLVDALHRMRQIQNQAPQRGALSNIKISFQLDPRLTRAMYMGERWVSPPTYMRAGNLDENEVFISTRVTGIDDNGLPLPIQPSWVSMDPEIVAVLPSTGDTVNIQVKRPGETRVKIISEGVAKELSVKASIKNDVMQVNISQ